MTRSALLAALLALALTACGQKEEAPAEAPATE
jgi:predicted small lipoprotein YifL